MENKRARRKRINFKEAKGEIVIDLEAWVKNKSTSKAKKIITTIEHIEIDIYFDKHYFDRYQHGDETGQREGIEQEPVRQLVVESAKHLLYYSTSVKSFAFVNANANTSNRVVLTSISDTGPDLNVVVEYHSLGMHHCEVTLKTAMAKYDFLPSDGTFQLKIYPDNSSTLHKNEMRKMLTLSTYEG